MKIILSRKGFDGKWGRIPSPIFQKEDGKLGLYSLPIPLKHAETCGYEDIQWNGSNLKVLLASLRRRCRTALSDTPHLDPDLVRGALRHRHSDWSCVFGQSGGTETLLRKAGVGALDGVGEEVFIKKGDPGPLFLFFGWYRRAVRDNRGYSFAPVAQGDGVHALFGWLQAARKVNFAGEVDRKAFARANPWAAKHPHVSCPCSDGQPNAIYIAPKPDTEEDVLNLDGVKTNLRASGMFSTFNPAVHTLTLQGHTKRVWRLPKWFFRGGEPTLGMHDNAPWRWQAINGQPEYIQLQSVDIGQEFVFNTERYDRELVHAWVKRIIEAGDGPLETLA